ncbi:hypothetical protein, partial [Streptomyces sp. NPDC047981]|uniref:hypothetical protein n=1 Tax=Streptomyces sp. NPDC047981 TaxID=3154610 RepID=UPI003415966A
MYGPRRTAAVTSATSPRTAHRTTAAPCAAATRSAAAQALSSPHRARLDDPQLLDGSAEIGELEL